MPTLVLVNPKNHDTLYGDYGWQPLALAVVAGATPEHWNVRIVDEVLAPATDADLQADVVALTSFTTQAPRAYALAERARALGSHTVLGGVHATFVADEAGAHVDTVVTGEAEQIWPQVLNDFEAGCIKARYDGGRVDMTEPVIPRRDLLTPDAYRYASVQTTRGCPLDCSFCSVTAFNGRTFRMSSPQWVVDELSRIPQQRVLIVDDDFNGFGNKARQRCLEVCNAISASDLNKRWLTQVTINFGEEDELPRAAAAAGCAAVFIGFESLDTADLSEVRKPRYKGRQSFADAVARIRGAGIAVIASFILGIDGQDIDRTVTNTLSFLEETGVDAFNPTIMTPLPGTRDFTRYTSEQRLIFDRFPGDWARYNLATPTVRSPGYTPARLLCAYMDWMQFFDPEAVLARAERSRRDLNEAAAEAAYLWNRAWSLHYKRALILPPDLPVAGARAHA